MELNDEGLLRLAEAVLALWRKDYLTALSVYKRHPTKENEWKITALEHQVPEYLLPRGVTAEEVIRTLRNSMNM